MNINDIKVGMKAVPLQKTKGERGLNNSKVWKQAIDNEQPFLYVNRINLDNQTITLDVTVPGRYPDGDFFAPEDVIPYVEQIQKQKEITNMQINEYPNGTLFQTESKDWYIKIDNRCLNLSDMRFMPMNDAYKKDTKTETPYVSPIVKIASISYIGDAFRAYKKGDLNIEALLSFKVLWQYEDAETQKLNAIISDLEKNLEDAKKQLKTLKGGN